MGAGNSAGAISWREFNAVYPRGCGELNSCSCHAAAPTGLSPWVRGTLELVPVTSSSKRFIPVGAGNSHTIAPLLSMPSGLSPWVRGTLTLNIPLELFIRFIPVGAGNSQMDIHLTPSEAVYPRGCGELENGANYVNIPTGLSPWVRGTRYRYKLSSRGPRFIPVGAGNSIWGKVGVAHGVGLSPWVRGTRIR